ncbi:MAG: HlyD family efflux transporter periplasmic adaptor subunit [Planctomycetia bacterium]|nr:HlyD family efflux transporter periplasmic adaptor subunit [Planctomycetia bacterium]
MRMFATIALFAAASSIATCVAAEPGGSGPVLERCLVSLIDEAKLSAGEAGLLVEMAVKAGDRVTAGQVIARINDDQPQMDKLRAQAEHDQAIAKAGSDVDVRYSQKAQAVAQKASEKAEQSHKNVPGSVTDVERDRLRLEWEKSGLQIEQAQLERTLADLAARAKDVEVKTADINIKRRLVTSPLDGEVVDVQGNLGEWMQVGAPLAHIVRTDKLRVEGYVDAAKWDPEQVRGKPATVEVTLANNRKETFEGRISFVSPLVESGGDYRVFAEVPNRKSPGSDEWLLRAGQTATMTIHSEQPASR